MQGVYLLKKISFCAIIIKIDKQEFEENQYNEKCAKMQRGIGNGKWA
jgi:hypothetical protein